MRISARRGRPWSLPLEDLALRVAAYWRTDLTIRQLAPLCGVSKSAADRVVDRLGPDRRRKGEVLPCLQEHNKSHKQVRARVEHVFARMYNLALTG